MLFPLRTFKLSACTCLLASTAALYSQSAPQRCRVKMDTSQAEAVLEILATRQAKLEIPPAQWQKLFTCEPYRRLKERETAMAKMFGQPAHFTDETFRAFVLSDALLAKAPLLKKTLEAWKSMDVTKTAERILAFLPSGAQIHAAAYTLIKPADNTFVWEADTNPAIMMALNPLVGAQEAENSLAHEMHHIGLKTPSLVAAQKALKGKFSVPVQNCMDCLGGFGEGYAMLAAAGGAGKDPQAYSKPDFRAAWAKGMANFEADQKALEAFFLDVLAGKFPNDDALNEKFFSFHNDYQGAWYTVGYKMAQLVEQRFGRPALLETMRDTRLLLRDYNRAARELNAKGEAKLPLWSEGLLKKLGISEG